MPQPSGVTDRPTRSWMNMPVTAAPPAPGTKYCGRKLPIDVDERRPHQHGAEVPERDVHALRPGSEDRRGYVDDEQEHAPSNGEVIDPGGRLAPLDRLRLAAEDPDGGGEDDELPGDEDDARELPREDTVAREPRHDPVEDGDEHVDQEPVTPPRSCAACESGPATGARYPERDRAALS